MDGQTSEIEIYGECKIEDGQEIEGIVEEYY
jgi:hypothetical protein